MLFSATKCVMHPGVETIHEIRFTLHEIRYLRYASQDMRYPSSEVELLRRTDEFNWRELRVGILYDGVFG